MHNDITAPSAAHPFAETDALAIMLAVHALFPREEVEVALEAFIDALNADDGDPDLEDGGDLESDGTDGGDLARLERLDGAAMTSADGTEDDEDDDCDFGAEERGEAGSWPEWDGGGQSTCHAYGDDDREDDEPAARQRHRERIQRTACDVEATRYGGFVERRYRLRRAA